MPYTGIMSIDPTLDHAGPMTATVADNALLLEVLAGPDGIDHRQQSFQNVAYTKSLGQPIDDMRIAVVREGFGHPNSQSDVDDKVREGAALFAKLGATVDEVTIPLHLHGPAIWGPIGFEGDSHRSSRATALVPAFRPFMFRAWSMRYRFGASAPTNFRRPLK